MEEKERYKVCVGSDYITICDYEENRIKALDNCGMQSLLNLQDNQIKAKEKEANTYAKEIVFLDNKIKLLERENKQLKKQVEELKGKRLEFYNDDVRQTQVINGVHFDIEQLLVFSEYVEHEKYISADKDKQINQLKQQLHDLPKKIVGEVEKNFTEYLPLKDKTGAGFYSRLNAILKKYGGEDA